MKKLNKFKILSIIILLFCCCINFCFAEEKKGYQSETDYSKFVKNPSALGFNPDYSLFISALNQMQQKFIENPTEQTLIAGINRELNILFKTAKINQSAHISSLNTISSEVASLSASTGLSTSLLWYATIQGLMAAMDDPYTLLLTPKDYRSLMEQMQAGTFGGIGVFIQQDKNNGNQLTVFEPIEGTTAYRAGILPEDLIIKINDEPTKTMPIDVAMAKLRGQVGTSVVLLIKRKTSDKLLKFTIVRENIKIHSVSCKLINKTVGYIKIRTFGDDTAKEFAKAMNALESKNIRSLIIDLRNNGGGLINAAQDLCSYMLGAGKTVVSVSDRTGRKNYLKSHGVSDLKIPCIVLINKYTASASEITAGALQDYGLAKLMGGKSYGKGSVQELLPLRNGGAFKITVAHYFTPKNRNINKIGITPDIKKEMDVTKVGRPGDIQLKAAVEYLKNK
ncbi:S41 family peptidase [bacterium]|nr:S41 family peptidase [bacterium]